MKKSKIIMVVLIALMMLGGLLLTGCLELLAAVASNSGNSCAATNGCNSPNYYCGRSSCAASVVGTSGCRCN
jgi:hypothetical protein